MSNFFERATLPTELPGRMLESMIQALSRQQHVICTAPVNISPASFYAFAAMMGDGMAVVVCPNRDSIQRDLAHLAQSGFDFPTVAVLDGHQPPHQEREVHHQAKHHRVKLLYVTPEEFDTLALMELMIHATLKFVVVEQAGLLLPEHSESASYVKLKQGLTRFRKMPTLLLLAPPMSPAVIERLIQTMNIPGAAVFSKDPLWRKTRVTVHMLTTGHQKFKRLVQLLLQEDPFIARKKSDKPKLGNIFEHGAVLIQAYDKAACDRLLRSLSHYGFLNVYAYHDKLSLEERRKIETVFASQPDVIVVQYGKNTTPFRGPSGVPFKLIHWQGPQCPQTLEAAVAQWFRLSPLQSRGQESLVDVHCFYTKEDYQRQLSFLAYTLQENHPALQEARSSLGRFRQWVLSRGCRLQTLLSYAQAEERQSIGPCGHCDRCRTRPEKFKSLQTFLKKILESLLY